MNACIMSFGVEIAVARAYVSGLTVGNVDIAPFVREYGSGHSRIMTKSLSPSCLRTRDRAAKRESFATRRFTKFDNIVRETMNAHREPRMVLAEAINHL